MAISSEVLADEEHDRTATEAHWRVLMRLYAAVSYAFGDRALVLLDIFVRTGGQQAAPDLLVAPGMAPGSRRVYSVPENTVPSVTVEVLSVVNYEAAGRAQLQRKRDFFGRIGVPLHLEVAPEEGVISVWTNQDGRLVRVAVADRYDGPDLGGVRVTTPAPDEVHVYLPDGREMLDTDAEIARAESEAAGAERLAGRLRELGIDPDEI
ncbi:MAG TPA: hypothetical protein VG184_03510 [Acidimicrobiales bacterium]|nr:hypothetical protein [Acidimicrobiales bacterium]